MTSIPGQPAGGFAEKSLICLVQPPLIQLNSPYPSLYYLRSFLEKQGFSVCVKDHSIDLFQRIFCRDGLKRIFADAESVYRQGAGRKGQDGAFADGMYRPQFDNREICRIVERFLSERDRWLYCVEPLTAFLRGRNREWGHFLTLANGALPGGPRVDAYLASNCSPSPEDAPLLAGKVLADLADFIAVCLDPGFALIRYLPDIQEDCGTGFRDFEIVKKGLGGYILRNFYLPFLNDEWNSLSRKMDGKDTLILGLSIPFPGCLTAALSCAESARAYFTGGCCITIAGGGYVNTELRFIETEDFFDYIDYLSFDRGYGSLCAILEHAERKDDADTVLYRTIYRCRRNGRIVRDPAVAAAAGIPPDRVARYEEIDRQAVKTVFPDYRGVDFSRYLYPVDGTNPMHRLWSDGHWIKAYLAYGCYWHNCAFCDVNLDYIKGYTPVNVEPLFRHLLLQSAAAGIRAVHLVDEAAPPASLIHFAELNRGLMHSPGGNKSLPLVFWGNIRFEKTFTGDVAALLAAGGLAGISAGIEVASEQGFKRIGKGIGLREVVNACAAFKEAGILTHAYLIYGYWDEDEQEIIDSAEILRQLFEAGLLDSAFWHKFVLTRHSRVYTEWQNGLHPALKAENRAAVPPARRTGKLFALNDLYIKGGERTDRYTEGLDQLLALWMAGDTASPVYAAFPFKTGRPSVGPYLVRTLLDEYARSRDRGRRAIPLKPEQNGTAHREYRAVFLGSRPWVRAVRPGRTVLFWRYRLSDILVEIPQSKAEKTGELLEKAALPLGMRALAFYAEMEALLGSVDAEKVWRRMRTGGLVLY
ncbi:MAG: radical SAM protein [Treponema sp.]|jgi:radical SAM superfamily enzyme YgiQ (UPF0313 family)|nr:radical SAM protein [Treponema sp.]